MRSLFFCITILCCIPVIGLSQAKLPEGYAELIQGLKPEQLQDLHTFSRHITGLEGDTKDVFKQLTLGQRGRLVQYAGMMKSNFANLEKTTVRWQPDSIKFGEIEERKILLDSFVVTNTGTQPYLIREVKTACDCTVLRYPKYPIAPGETASIRVEFDSKGKLGNTSAGIIIYDNSSPNRRNIVYMTGTVKPRMAPKAKSPLDY
jgi:Protein of unknown function (DUF1573)